VPDLTPLLAKTVERKMCPCRDEPIRITKTIESVEKFLHCPAEVTPKLLKLEIVFGLR